MAYRGRSISHSMHDMRSMHNMGWKPIKVQFDAEMEKPAC